MPIAVQQHGLLNIHYSRSSGDSEQLTIYRGAGMQLAKMQYNKCTTLLQGAKYIDRLKYQETQPTHKKGFQTSDFSRRDEFSMTFRTEQYRTLLKQVSTVISACAYVPVHLTIAQWELRDQRHVQQDQLCQSVL